MHIGLIGGIGPGRAVASDSCVSWQTIGSALSQIPFRASPTVYSIESRLYLLSRLIADLSAAK